MRGTRKPGALRQKKRRAAAAPPPGSTATAPTPGAATTATAASDDTWTSAAQTGAAEDQRLLARLAQRQRALSQVAGVLGQLQATSTADQRASTEAHKEAEDATRRAERDATLRAAAEQKLDAAARERREADRLAARLQTDVQRHKDQLKSLHADHRGVQARVDAWRDRCEASEACALAKVGLHRAELAGHRRTLDEQNLALGSATGALEAERNERRRAELTLGAEVDALRRGLQSEHDAARAAVEEAVAQRDAATTERDAALRDVSRQAEAFARRQDERDGALLTYQQDADTALDRSSAAAAACAAALADAARSRHAAALATTEAAARVDRDSADALEATRDAGETIKRAAQESALARAASAAADARAGRSDRLCDAAEARAAAYAAMRCEAVGYAADLTEAKLVADEDRDATKASAVNAAAAQAEAVNDRDALSEALRHAETVQDRLLANEAALSARCVQEKHRASKAETTSARVTQGADDALTAAAEGQRERDQKLRELDALSANLAQELETRVTELVANKQALQELEAASKRAAEKRAVQRRQHDANASEREALHASEKRMLRTEADRASRRTLDLEQERKAGFDRVLALEAAVACAEASKDLKQLELVDQVDRTDRAAATVQDLVAECTAAQQERDAARASRDAEKAKSQAQITDARKAHDKARKDLAHATKAGAKRCASFLRAKDDAIDGRTASDVAFKALRGELRQFTLVSQGIRKDAERCRDAARKADAVLEAARAKRDFIGATEARTADAADAARRAAGAVSRALQALGRARLAALEVDARDAVAAREADARRIRADAENALLEARSDRDRVAAACARHKEAHEASNAALRRATDALGREKDYAARIEGEGFGELKAARARTEQLEQAVGEVKAKLREESTKAKASEVALRDAGRRRQAEVASLEAKLRASERSIASDRERRDAECSTLRDDTARAQRERTDARAEADDLRSDLAQARRLSCDARDEVAALQRTLDEGKLERDALRQELEDVRAQVAEASQAARPVEAAPEVRPDKPARLSVDDQAEFAAIRRKLRSEATPQKREDPAPYDAPADAQTLRTLRTEALADEAYAGAAATPAPRKVLGRALDAARAAARFQAPPRGQRPSLDETDGGVVNAAPGWDMLGTRRSLNDPELAAHLARRDAAVAAGLVDAPPEEFHDDARPEEPETEAERKLRELEERAFDDAAPAADEEASMWTDARHRDRAARGLPPPAPLPLEIPEPGDHTTAQGERTPGAPRPDPQATIDATAAYLQMRRDRAPPAAYSETSVPRAANATPPPPSADPADDMEDAFGAIYASRPPAGAGSAPARARRGRPLPRPRN